MNKGALIIFSGLPGSGKSTLATRLASKIHAVYLRIDTIEQGLRDICGISQIDGMGYRLTYLVAKENLWAGNIVIADSVNPWSLTRREWNSIAVDVDVPFINIEVVCSDGEEHKKRVESRNSTVKGLKLPTWDEVVSRDYHPWEEDRNVLDTSGKDEKTSLEDLLSLLKNRGFYDGVRFR